MNSKNKNEVIEMILANNESKVEAVANIEGCDALEILDASKGLKFSLIANGDSVGSKDTNKEKLFFALRNTVDMNGYAELSERIAFELFPDFVKLGEKAITEIIEANLPRIDYASAKGFCVLSSLITLLTEKYEEKKASVERQIFATGDFEVIHSEINQDLIEKMQAGSDVVYALVHPMGHGKTTNCTRKMMGDNGVMVVSPKRVLASLICNDSKNYKNITHTTEKQTGVIGVINSLVFSRKFAEYRESTTTLIAEEHEEIMSQATGRAVKDGSLVERANLVNGYMELIKSANTVILMDAMFSTFSAKMIQERTGKRVIIVKPLQEAANAITVKIMNEAENVAIASQEIAKGHNVLAFCDGKNKGEHSKFNELFHAVGMNAKSKKAITANTISEEENEVEFIKGIEDVIASNQFTMVSPVINSGVSIENGHADSVHVFGHQVIPVKSLIQTMRRDRKATLINLSINSNFIAKPTSLDVIIATEMMKTTTQENVSDEVFTAYKTNEGIRTVASVISNENELRVNYELSTIIALRMLGFSVVFSNNEELKIDGRQIKTEGREIETAERVQALLDAKKIDRDAAELMGRKEFTTTCEKMIMARHDMESLYKQEISEELIAFDKKGETRKKVRNSLIANNMISPVTSASVIKKDVISLLLASLCIDINTFTGKFSKVDADKFVTNMSTGYIMHNGIKMKGSDAFKIAFNQPLPKGHSTAVVSQVLASQFGIKANKAGQETVNGKRVNMYIVNKADMNPELVEMMLNLYTKYTVKRKI